jgi:hypothetical protein
MATATWHGFTMTFQSAAEAREWLSALRLLHETDPDAAERVAYAGADWREALAREVA